MIGNGGLGGKVGGGGVDLGGKPVGKDGIIKPSENSPQPREGSRDIHEGIIISEPPDWCKRPDGTLIPYTIWAVQTASANLANSITQTGDRSHAKESLILHCHGDEKGWPNGGVKSGTVCAECTPKTWSETVFAEGRNMVRHDDEWWMNHKNTWGRLHYAKEPAPYTTPQVDEVQPKMWLAQALRTSRPIMRPGPGMPGGPMVFPVRPAPPPETNEPVRPEPEPGRPGNDNFRPNPQPAPEAPRQDPQAGPNTSIGPDASSSAKPAFKNEVVTVKRRRVDCTCLVGTYASIEYRCRIYCYGQAHHLIPDMVFRYDSRPKSKEERTSDTSRIMGAPTHDNGVSACISETAHVSVHNFLRKELNDLGSTSGVPGTARLGKIFGVAEDSIRKLRRNHDCNETIKAALKEQNRLIPYNNIGRTQERLPLSDKATDALKYGTY